MNRYKVHFIWQSCVPIVLIILLVPVFLFAQGDFFVQSTLPADGDVSVDPYGTLQITFSESIDTTVLFEYPPYFYINLALEPDTLMGEPDSITFDPTFTTIYVHNLKLYSDTKYLLLVNNAVSLDGDSLDIPYVATFTTGESLPTAKMTGTVDFPGENPRGAIVSLRNNSLFSDEDGSTESATVVVEATGEYLVQYIPPGTYWPVAFFDVYIDSDGDFSPRENSAVGFYDSNGDMVPDSIEITEGDSISAIDIFLTKITSGTARQYYEDVKHEALSWAADAVLIGITGPYIDEHGETYIWGYTFYSETLDEARDWMAFGPMIIPEDTFESPPSNTTALPENWIDSDMASDSAEFYGGQQFREENENFVVIAFLGYSLSIDDDDDDDGNKKFNLNKILKKNTTYSTNRKPSKMNNDPYWYYIYVGEEEDAFLLIFVNAITGEVAGAVTAREAEQASRQEALQWAADIELVGVMAWHDEGILEDGTSSTWAVQYYSPAFDSNLTVFTFNGIVLTAFSGHGLPAPDVIPIPPNWIDSDTVMTVAEANGGLDYRNSNEGIVVHAFLGSGLIPWKIDKIAWVIFYNSHTSETMTIYVDALTGEILELSMPTAKEAEISAHTSALNWATDAVLVGVGTAFDYSIDPEGRATYWNFSYYSTSLNSYYNVFTSFFDVIYEWHFFDAWPYADQELPLNWLDSDSATFIAENNGGKDFRNSHEDDYIARAELKRANYEPDLTLPVWHFYYESDVDTLNLYVDCVSGQILTEVEDINESCMLPTIFELKQNYPNPFNPSTSIEYTLKNPGLIKLEIYNELGQLVRTLIDEEKDVGTYSTIWDGKDYRGNIVSSGTYFYQIKMKNSMSNKKMLIVR